MIRFNRFKDGTRHIVTMSYDDAHVFDIRLAELFNKYGIRGTFNVNTVSQDSKVDIKDYKAVYENHEVAVHTVTHPYLEVVPVSTQMAEIMENRKAIESAVGYVVRGMAYPFGTYNDEVINTAKTCGIVYSRTVNNTKGFVFPKNYMEWHPSCHHKDAMPLAERFVADMDIPWRTNLFYIWGHSFELRTEDDWAYMEELCKKISGLESVWYATNIEIYDYMSALGRLEFSADETIVHNPSAIKLWFEKDGNVISIEPGESLEI